MSTEESQDQYLLYNPMTIAQLQARTDALPGGIPKVNKTYRTLNNKKNKLYSNTVKSTDITFHVSLTSKFLNKMFKC